MQQRFASSTAEQVASTYRCGHLTVTRLFLAASDFGFIGLVGLTGMRRAHCAVGMSPRSSAKDGDCMSRAEAQKCCGRERGLMKMAFRAN